MSRGKSCWVDLEDIRPAADWLEAIEAGIDEGLCFAVVIGRPWLDSEVCKQEYDRALSNNKRLIPILRHDVDMATLPDGLRRSNWIMMRDSDDFDVQFERLIEAMETDLAWIERHARLTVRTREWTDGGHDRGALLRGRDLADAEDWFAAQGRHGETPTAAQGEFIVASRRARGRASRIRLVAVTAALVVSAGLGVLALLQRNQAQENERSAVSRQLAALSQAAGVRRDLDTAGLLGVEALRAKTTDEARTATLQSLLPRDRALGVLGSSRGTNAVALSPDGRRLAVGEANGNIALWDVRGRRRIATFGTAARVDAVDASSGVGVTISALQFSPDGQLLAAAGLGDGSTGSLRVWDVRRGTLLQRRSFRGGYVYGLLFSGPRRLVWAAGPHIRLWDLKSGSDAAPVVAERPRVARRAQETGQHWLSARTATHSPARTPPPSPRTRRGACTSGI